MMARGMDPAHGSPVCTAVTPEMAPVPLPLPAPVPPLPVPVPPDPPPAPDPPPPLLPLPVKVNWSAGLVGLVPLQVVTVTSTVPVPGGDVAVMVVELTTVKVAAGVLPNLTPVTQVNPVPVMVTVVLPVDGPLFGTTPVTVGGVATTLMSGPVAAHFDSAMVIWTAVASTVIFRASTVMLVDPGELATT